MSKRNRIKDFAPRVIGAAVALLIATLVGLTFWPDMPKVPTHQPVSTFESQFSILRPDCLAAGIAALPSDARAAKKAECDKQAYAARQTHRDALQSIRATNASEDGLWLAYQQAQVGIIQAILTVMALLATAWAAWAAADAAKAADRSLTHANDVMRNELRAYVHVEKAELKWGINGSTPRISLFAKNTGQTPAKWFGVTSKVVEFEKSLPRMREDFDGIDLSDREIYQWPALGGSGSELSFPGSRDDDKNVLRAAYGKSSTLHVVGTLRYQTIFDEIYETEFWFLRTAKHTELMKRPEGAPEGVAVFGTATETPRLMQRAAIALNTYKKVSSPD